VLSKRRFEFFNASPPLMLVEAFYWNLKNQVFFLYN